MLPKNGRTASARPRRAAAVGARRAVKETLSKRSPGMSDFVVEDDEDEASQGSDDGESENEEELAEFDSSEEETDVSGESEMSSSSDESDHGGDQDEEFDEEDAARSEAPSAAPRAAGGVGGGIDPVAARRAGFHPSQDRSHNMSTEEIREKLAAAGVGVRPAVASDFGLW